MIKKKMFFTLIVYGCCCMPIVAMESNPELFQGKNPLTPKKIVDENLTTLSSSSLSTSKIESAADLDDILSCPNNTFMFPTLCFNNSINSSPSSSMVSNFSSSMTPNSSPSSSMVFNPSPSMAPNSSPSSLMASNSSPSSSMVSNSSLSMAPDLFPSPTFFNSSSSTKERTGITEMSKEFAADCFLDHFAMLNFSTTIDALFYYSEPLDYAIWTEKLQSIDSSISFLLRNKINDLVEEIGRIVITLSNPQVFNNLCDIFSKRQMEEKTATTLSNFFLLCSKAAVQLENEPLRDSLCKIGEAIKTKSKLDANYYDVLDDFAEAVRCILRDRPE